MSPVYDYQCPDHGEFEEKAGFDDKTARCPITQCSRLSTRVAVYQNQGVHYKGTGFTLSVTPPKAPNPPSTKGESTDTAFEIQDEFAKKHYEHDVNDRPYEAEERSKYGKSD